MSEATLTYPELPKALRVTVQDSVYRNQAEIGHYHHMLAQLQGHAAADQWCERPPGGY